MTRSTSTTPAKKAAAKKTVAAAPDTVQEEPKRPKGAPADADDMSEWVAYAIRRGVPSYVAWAKTKDDLIKELI